MVQALRTASDEANTRGSQLLAKYYEDHPELAPDSVERAMSQASLIRIATNTEIERRVRPVLDTFERQQANQQAMVGALRVLSPALLMQDALNDIAGTGTARHRAFVAQVGRFHEDWRGYFVPRIFRGDRLATLSDLPRFTFAEEPGSTLIARVAVSLLVLCGAAVAIGVAGLRALRRYPVAA
jgi:ABC-2 type transport system permease protein